jgi:hypothetical protein
VASVGGGAGRSPLHLPLRAVEEGRAGDQGDVGESGSCRTQEGGSRAHVVEGGSWGHMSAWATIKKL